MVLYILKNMSKLHDSPYSNAPFVFAECERHWIRIPVLMVVVGFSGSLCQDLVLFKNRELNFNIVNVVQMHDCSRENTNVMTYSMQVKQDDALLDCE